MTTLNRYTTFTVTWPQSLRLAQGNRKQYRYLTAQDEQDEVKDKDMMEGLDVP